MSGSIGVVDGCGDVESLLFRCGFGGDGRIVAVVDCGGIEEGPAVVGGWCFGRHG